MERGEASCLQYHIQYVNAFISVCPVCILENPEEKEPDGDCISYEIIAVPPQTRKRKMTTRRRNALSAQEALELDEGSIHA
mgnify:CR=1 FL=1